MNPPPPRTASSAADDTLRQRLQALTPHHAPVAALGDRVLAQWRELHPEAALQPAGQNGAALLLPPHAADRRRRWLGATAALLMSVVVVTAWWLQRPDPTVDELLQADVLSQMAIGEL